VVHGVSNFRLAGASALRGGESGTLVSQPGFIVVVNIPLSWLFQPGFPTLLTGWARGYVDSGYEISGVVDILSNEKTVYKWGEQARSYIPRSVHHLLIYKRRT